MLALWSVSFVLLCAWSQNTALPVDTPRIKTNGTGVSDCPHTEDVGVVCSDKTSIINMNSTRFQESNSEVRIEHSLNKNEEEFRARRRNTVQQSLKRNGINCRVDTVPNIALLGSGGGQRAMVGLLGSLDQLQKTSLLDSILYLGGVSGSTWCMASIYQEPDWSTKLESVKNKTIQRLSGPKVSWGDALAKLKKYYYEKDIFSLTDFWAAIVVTTFVKEIDEQPFTKYWNQQSKDPFPIYTVIDKKYKQKKEGDPWFEFTPHEAGYSLTGAFVGVSNFGSQFEKGSMIKKQPEIDMLYLQGLCGSALADGDENLKFIWQKIKGPVLSEQCKGSGICISCLKTKAGAQPTPLEEVKEGAILVVVKGGWR